MPVEKAKRLSNLVSLGGNERNWGVIGDNASILVAIFSPQLWRVARLLHRYGLVVIACVVIVEK